MKYTLEIDKGKVKSFQEVIKSLDYIKNFKPSAVDESDLENDEVYFEDETLEQTRDRVKREIAEAVDEVNQILIGKKEGRSFEDMIRDL